MGIPMNAHINSKTPPPPLLEKNPIRASLEHVTPWGTTELTPPQWWDGNTVM